MIESARAPGATGAGRGLAEDIAGQRSRKVTSTAHTAPPIDLVLSRLDGVVQCGDEYRAFSPFQQRRRNRTLSIKERDDGAVLLHDFGGADTSAILGAIGLEFHEIYPAKPTASSPLNHERWKPRISPGEAMALMSVESWLILMFGQRVISGQEIDILEYQRARDAVARLEQLRLVVER